MIKKLLSILLFMIMLFAFRMNAEANLRSEERRNTFLTVPIVSALGLTLNESASDAMVGGAVTQNDKFQVKHGDYS